MHAEEALIAENEISYNGDAHNTDPTPQGRIIMNADIDFAGYVKLDQKRRTTNPNTYYCFYPSGQGWANKQMQRGDVMLQWKESHQEAVTSIYESGKKASMADKLRPKTMVCMNDVGVYDEGQKIRKAIASGEMTTASLLRLIRSQFRFAGIANAYWQFTPKGQHQEENKRLDYSLQTGGIAPARAGPRGITAGERVVWNASNPRNLAESYPRVSPLFAKNRAKDSIYATLETYDIKDEFSLDLAFEEHRVFFKKCIGHEFTRFDMLPSNYDFFKFDVSMASWYKALYATIFNQFALYEASNSVLTITPGAPWVGKVRGEDTTKILAGGQKIITKAQQRTFPIENDRLINMKLHMMTLIALEAQHFAGKTDVYVSPSRELPAVAQMRKVIAEPVNQMYTIEQNIIMELHTREVGIACTSAGPGKQFHMQGIAARSY